MCMEINADDEVQVPQGQISNLIMHNLPLRAIHYASHPTMISMQKLRNKRIMHDYFMRYEKVNCQCTCK
jgi:hypothetical protein